MVTITRADVAKVNNVPKDLSNIDVRRDVAKGVLTGALIGAMTTCGLINELLIRSTSINNRVSTSIFSLSSVHTVRSVNTITRSSLPRKKSLLDILQYTPCADSIVRSIMYLDYKSLETSIDVFSACSKSVQKIIRDCAYRILNLRKDDIETAMLRSGIPMRAILETNSLRGLSYTHELHNRPPLPFHASGMPLNVETCLFQSAIVGVTPWFCVVGDN